MMLFKLSLKNTRKSMKEYAIYFCTIILGVAIFYVFNAVESQTVMLEIAKSNYVWFLNSMLSVVSVFIAVILGFLYFTLGMSKQKVSKLLFFEILFIGVISLGVGLVLGILLSQFMSVIVANMFEADLSKYEFLFSQEACVKTIVCFMVMYLVVMLFNTIQVNKYKLIDLLQAKRKNEKVYSKNALVCVLLFFVSCALLAYAYVQATIYYEHLFVHGNIWKTAVAGAVGTILLFWSLAGLIIRIFAGMKNTYYKELNCFVIKQFSSKMNTMVFSMSVISLMLFVTICMFSSAFSLSNSMNNSLRKYVPADVEMSIPYESANKDKDMETLLTDNKLEPSRAFQNYAVFDEYRDQDLTLKATLGNELDRALKENPSLKIELPETIVTLSDYNRVAELYGNETYTLKDDEYIIVSNLDSMTTVRNYALSANTAVTVNKNTLHPKYTQCKEGFVHMTAAPSNSGFFVVPDDVVTDSMKFVNYLVANYMPNDNNIENTLMDIANANDAICTTKTFLAEKSIGLEAMFTFVGLYVGIIFLVASAAVLALKELSESADNIERYAVLRKIGTDEKMINRALFKQIGIFFLLPLGVASIHSIFGVQFAMKTLESFGNAGLTWSIILTAIIVILIYGVYFLITYVGSKNMIKDSSLK